jgi:hypothetical protein
MMKKTYNTKSAIIGRKKKLPESQKDRPCFLHLFDHNNPHTSGQVPQEMHEFLAHKIFFKGLDFEYLVEGNDILINDLTELTILEKEPGHIFIEGKQD